MKKDKVEMVAVAFTITGASFMASLWNATYFGMFDARTILMAIITVFATILGLLFVVED